MKPDFSIVIPTLDSEKFISETLESIKRQDKSLKIECIFSDGGSKDQTLDIINNFNQTNISTHILYDQLGLSKALNAGFKLASGVYLTYLNSDDVLHDDTLIYVKKKFLANINSEWIIGSCENFGKKIFLNRIINFYKKKIIKHLNFKFLCIHNIISQPSVYWKNTLYDEVGNFNEKLKYNMDYDMWLRMYLVSKPIITEKKMSYFRRHNNSLSHKNLYNQFLEKYKTMRRYNKNILLSMIHLIISFLIVMIYKISNY